MVKEVTILLAEDDPGHAGLIRKNLIRAGINNPLLHFSNGQEIVDFLFQKGKGSCRKGNGAYVLLLDIRLPKLDGTEVLRLIKLDPELRKIPVIMVTTTDDPKEVEHCHALGCNNYITKPVEYESFIHAIQQLGLFLSIVEVPTIDDSSESR
jgi:CheY-like chemotaxis protein